MNTTSHLSSKRGAVLIVAMIFCILIAIALGSFLNISNTVMRTAHRSLYNNAAMNLSETGLEEAMWSINQYLEGNNDAWDNWSKSGQVAVRKLTGFNLGNGATGMVRIYVRGYNGSSTPTIVTRATINPGGSFSSTIEKWIEVKLGRRSLFLNGLVARDNITFSGNNASVDSYDSRKGAYDASLSGGEHNKYDRGTAGSTSVQVDSVSIGNADIWGYASIGTSDFSGLDVGPNGRVGPFGTSNGEIVADNVTTDFTANFEDVTAPTKSAYSISSLGSTSLPRLLDFPSSDGKYYYRVNSISLSGKSTNILQINNDVVIVMTPSTGTAISVGGNASIRIASGASLSIYTEADVSISGNGVANSNDPSSFFIWGTRAGSDSSSQSISVSGNGVLSGVVYAPAANVSVNGGGSSGNVYGAVLGRSITVTGSSSFHYDESLADMNSDASYGMTSWNELTSAASRETYASVLGF